MERDGVISSRRIVGILVVILVVVLVVYLFPVPPVGVGVEELAWPDSMFIDINEFKVHYIEKGNGEPVFLLLHGFGSSVFTWREVSGNLSRYGRVIAFDRPGFGLTERKPPRRDFNPYTTDGAVELTCLLIDKLGVNQAILVGHSAGGGLALLVASRCNVEVGAVVLIAPSWKPFEMPMHEKLLYSIPLVDKIGPLIARSMVNSLEKILYKAWYNSSRLTRDVIEGYRYPLKAKDWDKGLYWLLKHRGFPDIMNKLHEIKAPVLVIHGLNDEIIPYENSIELANKLADYTTVRLELLNECGHLPHEEKPSEFLDVLVGFLLEKDIIRDHGDVA